MKIKRNEPNFKWIDTVRDELSKEYSEKKLHNGKSNKHTKIHVEQDLVPSGDLECKQLTIIRVAKLIRAVHTLQM